MFEGSHKLYSCGHFVISFYNFLKPAKVFFHGSTLLCVFIIISLNLLPLWLALSSSAVKVLSKPLPSFSDLPFPSLDNFLKTKFCLNSFCLIFSLSIKTLLSRFFNFFLSKISSPCSGFHSFSFIFDNFSRLLPLAN